MLDCNGLIVLKLSFVQGDGNLLIEIVQNKVLLDLPESKDETTWCNQYKSQWKVLERM